MAAAGDEGSSEGTLQRILATMQQQQTQQSEVIAIMKQQRDHDKRRDRRGLLDRGQGVAAALGVVVALIGEAVLQQLLSPAAVISSPSSSRGACAAAGTCQAWAAAYGYASALSFFFTTMSLVATVGVAIGMSEWIMYAMLFFLATLTAIAVAVTAVSFMLFPLGTAAGIGAIMAALLLITFGALAIPAVPLAYYMFGKKKQLMRPPMKDEAVSRVISDSKTIHWAADQGRTWHNLLLKVMLAAGDDPDVRAGPHRITALHVAAWKGNHRAARILLKQQPNMNAQDVEGWTPLHYAVHFGHEKVVKELLEAGANVECTINTPTPGTTPLMLACFSKVGKAEIVELLLNHHADLNAKDGRGWTPLHMMCSRGRVDALAKALERRPAAVDLSTQTGASMDRALHKAVFMGHASVVSSLLECSAWCRLGAGEQREQIRKAMFMAAGTRRAGVDAAVRAIFAWAKSQGAGAAAAAADPNQAGADQDTRSPLQLAHDCGNHEVAQVMRSEWADVMV